MKHVCLLLFFWMVLGTDAAVGGRPTFVDPNLSCRYLFLIDTSLPMNRYSATTRNTVYDLIASEFRGDLKPGDVIGIWTFNWEVRTSDFVAQTWEVGESARIANSALDFLRERRGRRTADIELAVRKALEAVSATDLITLFIVTDGSILIRGTPFDQQINSLFLQHRSEFQKSRRPFVVSLIGHNGVLIDGSVSAGGGEINIPRVPSSVDVATESPLTVEAAHEMPPEQSPVPEIDSNQPEVALKPTLPGASESGAAELESREAGAPTNLASPPLVTNAHELEANDAEEFANSEALELTEPPSGTIDAQDNSPLEQASGNIVVLHQDEDQEPKLDLLLEEKPVAPAETTASMETDAMDPGIPADAFEEDVTDAANDDAQQLDVSQALNLESGQDMDSGTTVHQHRIEPNENLSNALVAGEEASGDPEDVAVSSENPQVGEESESGVVAHEKAPSIQEAASGEPLPPVDESNAESSLVLNTASAKVLEGEEAPESSEEPPAETSVVAEEIRVADAVLASDPRSATTGFDGNIQALETKSSGHEVPPQLPDDRSDTIVNAASTKAETSIPAAIGSGPASSSRLLFIGCSAIGLSILLFSLSLLRGRGTGRPTIISQSMGE